MQTPGLRLQPAADPSEQVHQIRDACKLSGASINYRRLRCTLWRTPWPKMFSRYQEARRAEFLSTVFCGSSRSHARVREEIIIIISL